MTTLFLLLLAKPVWVPNEDIVLRANALRAKGVRSVRVELTSTCLRLYKGRPPKPPKGVKEVGALVVNRPAEVQGWIKAFQSSCRLKGRHEPIEGAATFADGVLFTLRDGTEAGFLMYGTPDDIRETWGPGVYRQYLGAVRTTCPKPSAKPTRR